MVVLTEAQVLARARGSTLSRKNVQDYSTIRNLNLWGQDLTDVSVMEKFPCLQVISLAVNSLKSLAAFRNVHTLVELYLRKNQISSLDEIAHLKDLKSLRVLWLHENPIANLPSYRQHIISTLPQLRKLDEKDITDDEKALYIPNWHEDLKRQGDIDLANQLKASHPLTRPAIDQHLQGGCAKVVENVHSEPLGRIDHGWEYGGLYSDIPIERSNSQNVMLYDRDTKVGPDKDNEANKPQVQKVNGLSKSPSQVRKRPSWLGSSEDIKSSIRSASNKDSELRMPNSQTNLSPPNPMGKDMISAKTQENILTAVLALVRELDNDSLQLVDKEISHLLSRSGQI